MTDLSSPHSSLKGKVAVVTGSTQGLGEATARLFAARGAAGTIITGRNAERGEAVARDLSDAGCPSHFVQADLASVTECRNIMSAADAHFGQVDILVNSGALTLRGNIWDTTPELWDKMMAINVRAPFILIQDACRIMRREGSPGSVINVSSVASFGSEPFLLPYAASKGALNIATKNIAYSVMRYHIRVNALAIGWMDTPGEHTIQKEVHHASDDWLDGAEEAQPFGRLLKVDEVARAIAFLASDESGMMTGAVVDFDQSVRGAGDVAKPPPLDDPYWDIGA